MTTGFARPIATLGYSASPAPCRARRSTAAPVTTKFEAAGFPAASLPRALIGVTTFGARADLRQKGASTPHRGTGPGSTAGWTIAGAHWIPA